MLSAIVRKKVELRFQQSVRYSSDCDALSRAIYAQTKCQISASTLKRMFGFYKWAEPRLASLDAIATYCGYNSYDDLLNDIVEGKPKREQRIESIECAGLKRGVRFHIQFGIFTHIEIECVSSNRFRLLSQDKSGLIVGDVLELRKVELNLPMLVNRIKRNELTLTGLIVGKVTGVTEIKKIKKQKT